MSERMLVRRGSDIGLAIAEARRFRGLSQQGLAELSGIERTYLARLEAGHSVVLVERALRTLRRLGAEVVIELPGP